MELKFLSLSIAGCLLAQIPEGQVMIPAAVATLQISSHPPGAAPARGPFLIQALYWHLVNVYFSLGSLRAHRRHSSFFPLALLRISSSLCFLLQANPWGFYPCFAEHDFQTLPSHSGPPLDMFQLPRAHSNNCLNSLADELDFFLQSDFSKRRQAVSHCLNNSTG